MNPEIKNEKVPVKNELTEIQFQMNEDENTILSTLFFTADFKSLIVETTFISLHSSGLMTLRGTLAIAAR